MYFENTLVQINSKLNLKCRIAATKSTNVVAQSSRYTNNTKYTEVTTSGRLTCYVARGSRLWPVTLWRQTNQSCRGTQQGGSVQLDQCWNKSKDNLHLVLWPKVVTLFNKALLGGTYRTDVVTDDRNMSLQVGRETRSGLVTDACIY